MAWIALLVIALLPLLFGEMALAPIRRAARTSSAPIAA
jgi:hypothetical protein